MKHAIINIPLMRPILPLSPMIKGNIAAAIITR